MSKSGQNSGRGRCFVFFLCFARFAKVGIALGSFGVEPFGSSRWFSAWLAQACWCANLQQNRRHHPTHLPWGHRTTVAFPWLTLVVNMKGRKETSVNMLSFRTFALKTFT